MPSAVQKLVPQARVTPSLWTCLKSSEALRMPPACLLILASASGYKVNGFLLFFFIALLFILSWGEGHTCRVQRTTLQVLISPLTT